MERWDKKNNAEVDSILHQLKKDTEKPSKIDDADLDSILAGLGMGAKGGAPTSAPAMGGQKPGPAPRLASARVGGAGQAPAAAPKDAHEQPAPTPVAKKKKMNANTTIWDLEIEHGPVQPRVGKAAALDKVEPDKFAGDTELQRWFTPEEKLTRRERKQREKEEKARLKAIQREEKQRRRRGLEEPFENPPEDLDDPFGGGVSAPPSAGAPPAQVAQAQQAPAAVAQKETLVDAAQPPVDVPQQNVPAPQAAHMDGIIEAAQGPLKVDAGRLPLRQKPAKQPTPPPMEVLQAELQREIPPAAPAQKVVVGSVPPPPTPAAAAGWPAQPAAVPAQKTAASGATASFPKINILPPVAAQNRPAGRGPNPLPPPKPGFVPPPSEEGTYFEPPQPDAQGLFAARDEEAWQSPQKAPMWDAVDLDEVVTGSAFDEGPCDDSWPAEGSLFDTLTKLSVEEINQEAESNRPAESSQPAAAPQSTNALHNTQSYEVMEDGEGEFARVPSAAFTQEFAAETGKTIQFGAQGATQETTKSLFVDEMVDDRFRQFFSETVIVDREDIEQAQAQRKKAKRRRKRAHTLGTGEFAQLEKSAEWESAGEQAADEAESEVDATALDYERPQDAGAVEGQLHALKNTLLVRTGITALIGLLLLWQALALTETLGMPTFLSPFHSPVVYGAVYLVLLVAALAVNFTTVAAGLAGLFGTISADTPPALAAVAALMQGVVVMVQFVAKNPVQVTLFGCVAAILLVFNTLGKWLRARAILANFQLASAGFDHSAAYVLEPGHEVAYEVTNGMEEESPVLLVSRPTALVKGFMRQSFSARWSDKLGKILGWVLLACGIAVALVAYFQTGQLLLAISSLAAVLCIGAPLSSTLLSAIPSTLLQQSTTKVGAVVPGWSAIEELGEVNTVMAAARDIFPPASIQLLGIKTFEKERIDLAILYAASVLIKGCATLRDIFLAVIQGKSDMLYKVESLTVEPGRGFTAWVQNSRVVIGTREMLRRHDIDPPDIEVEMKYLQGGRLPVYLAVSGKLFAMFILSYTADEEVQDTLDGLVKSGVSLLLTSDDMNVTEELIEQVYQLPHGALKIMGQRELELLEPLTAYRPESEGVMTHIGTFASFIGGMRAAAGCAASERLAGYVQVAAALLATLISVLFVFSGALAGLPLPIVLFYQFAWTLFVCGMALARRY